MKKFERKIVKEGVGLGGLGQELSGKEFIVEGYWHELTGMSVFDYDLHNPAVYEFCNRVFKRIMYEEPIEHEYEVVYGHIKEGDAYIGHLFFEDELEDIKEVEKQKWYMKLKSIVTRKGKKN